MNNTYNKFGINPSSFEIYQCYKPNIKPKKSSMMISNSKNAFKQAFLSGINSPGQLKTLYSNYNHFPSLSKCHSTLKISKVQNNSRLSSQSFFQIQNNKISPSPPQNINSINRLYNDKSASTMQSTDDRKEIIKLKAEIKDKNEMIKTLNKTIDNYIKDNKVMSNEIQDISSQLIESHKENAKLKLEIKNMQLLYNRLKNNINTNSNKNSSPSKEFKLAEIMELINKEEISNNNNINETENSIKFEEQSLSAICFTDKVKMEKTISISDNVLPTLNFDMIVNINNKKDTNGFGAVELNNQKFKSIENINEDVVTKYVSKNNSAIIGSYNKQKITFGHRKGI